MQVALDVDKDNYDKFGMRHSIDLLLMELWKVRPGYKPASWRRYCMAAGISNTDRT